MGGNAMGHSVVLDFWEMTDEMNHETMVVVYLVYSVLGVYHMKMVRMSVW